MVCRSTVCFFNGDSDSDAEDEDGECCTTKEKAEEAVAATKVEGKVMQSEAAGRVTEVPGIEVAGEVAGEAAGEVAEEAVNDTACGAGEGKDEELQFKEDEQYMHKLVNQPASERVSGITRLCWWDGRRAYAYVHPACVR